MKINKISIPKLKQNIEENNINETSASLLIATAKMTNDLIEQIETEGTLIRTKSREGDLRVKQNPLLNMYFQSITSLNNLLKTNGLIVIDKKIKEEKEESKIETLLTNLNNMKKELR